MRLTALFLCTALTTAAHGFEIAIPQMPMPEIDWQAAKQQTDSIGSTVATTFGGAAGEAGRLYDGASGAVIGWSGEARDGVVWAWNGSSAVALDGWSRIEGSSPVQTARLYAMTGWDVYAADPSYWHDLAVVATVSTLAGAGANVSCAAAVSSTGPVIMASVGGACGVVGARAAADSLPMLYDRLGWEIDAEALRRGARIGGVLGVATASLGVGSFGPGTFVEGAKVAWPAVKAGLTVDDLIDRYYAVPKQQPAPNLEAQSLP